MLNCSSFVCEQDGVVRISSPRISCPIRLWMTGDWHAAHDDERGIPFQQYSCRMAQWHHPMDGVLAGLLQEAASAGAQAAFLAGDMISFPTEKGVEILRDAMTSSPIPCHYISGNHDWHYEGLPGHDCDLRREWMAKRLSSLYAGRNPLMYAVRLAGVKILMMDNSTSEILPEQLEWLKNELIEDIPSVLCVHIPLYIPGAGQSVTCCMGHPDWGWESDPYFEIERRERWPRSGVSETTRAFLETVWSSGNLLGVMCGHTHRYTGMMYRGKWQIIAASGKGHLIELTPA